MSCVVGNVVYPKNHSSSEIGTILRNFKRIDDILTILELLEQSERLKIAYSGG